MTSAQLHDPRTSLSETLATTADSITGERISLRQVLELIGEQGMLLFCVLLTIPFLLPVAIPGVSTPFGLLIIFIGIGIMLNRVPWLPARLMNQHFPTGHLKPALHKGAGLMARLDRFIRPRALMLTGSNSINRFNGLMIIIAAALLMLPLGVVPLTNTLPAWAVLVLAVGMLQRDGVFVAAGYGLVVATIIWFSVLAVGVLLAGQGLTSLLA
ncbi:MAG: exopolysaccharide biosynthesis protein [Anaerolineae bacterium]|nr:exopolysaccharide biosynthesis protein [Anaerolineae bacterium]